MNKKIEVPQLAKDHGMTVLVFEDDFDSIDTIDVNNTGDKGYKWYVERPYRHTTLTAGVDYKVSDSVLTLCNVDHLWNYGIGTYHPTTKVGFSFCQGVIEVRLRIPFYEFTEAESHEIGVPAFWSFPPNKITDETLEWVEPDWMEYWGNGYWTTSIHHLKREVHKGPYIYKSTNSNKRGPEGLNDGEWHTMTFLWDEGRIEAYLDGKQTMTLTYGDGKVTPPERVYVGECLGDQYHTMAWEPQTLIMGGSEKAPMEVDWVRVWQK
ncbi:MAG: family 16 glycosylhydrolase [Clostridia bacterium]|nr:family 16 glycosylhydrolase [Clostridia bacterium]